MAVLNENQMAVLGHKVWCRPRRAGYMKSKQSRECRRCEVTFHGFLMRCRECEVQVCRRCQLRIKVQ